MFRESFGYATAIFPWINRAFYRSRAAMCKKQAEGLGRVLQQTLFAASNYAFDNLAGQAGNVFDWGLPFFFGRRIFTAIASRPPLGGRGPYYART
jgi:hypothetical protein